MMLDTYLVAGFYILPPVPLSVRIGWIAWVLSKLRHKGLSLSNLDATKQTIG